MVLEVKICGLNSPDAVAAALAGGADLVGFNFYPKTPRAVSPQQAAELARPVGPGTLKVGILVDPDDATLTALVKAVKLDLLQLHGAESPRRVAEIRALGGLPVMKVIKLAKPEDLGAVADYLPVAERLLFDAKPPADRADALPGGNAVSFDWQILAGKTWPRPWMLSGGLSLDNLARAVRASGARAVDVASGVETAPGRKDPQKIKDFLAAAKAL